MKIFENICKKFKNNSGFTLMEVVMALGLISMLSLFVGVCLANSDIQANNYNDTSVGQMDAYSAAQEDLASTGSLSTNETNTLNMTGGSFTGFTTEIGCEEKTYTSNGVSYEIFKPVQ